MNIRELCWRWAMLVMGVRTRLYGIPLIGRLWWDMRRYERCDHEWRPSTMLRGFHECSRCGWSTSRKLSEPS